VNTDSRMLTPTTMTREYEHVARVFGWGPEEFLRANQMGAQAAFVDAQTKRRLGERLRDAYATLAAQ